MTTWTIMTSAPAVVPTEAGTAAFVDCGLRLDDSVTGTGNQKSLLDHYTGSTAPLKIGKLLAHLQRHDKLGRQYQAYEAGGPTTIKPTL